MPPHQSFIARDRIGDLVIQIGSHIGQVTLTLQESTKDWGTDTITFDFAYVRHGGTNILTEKILITTPEGLMLEEVPTEGPLLMDRLSPPAVDELHRELHAARLKMQESIDPARWLNALETAMRTVVEAHCPGVKLTWIDRPSSERSGTRPGISVDFYRDTYLKDRSVRVLPCLRWSYDSRKWSETCLLDTQYVSGDVAATVIRDHWKEEGPELNSGWFNPGREPFGGDNPGDRSRFRIAESLMDEMTKRLRKSIETLQEQRKGSAA